MRLLSRISLLAIVLSCPVVAWGGVTIAGPADRDRVPAYAFTLIEQRIEVLADADVMVVALDDADARIRLILDAAMKPELGREGFRIDVADGRARIKAADGPGLLFGVCGFIEWVMAHTTDGLIDRENVDIDFPVQRGQAKTFLANLPDASITETPFYSLRGAQMTNFAMGVADLIDTDKKIEKYNPYSGIYTGYAESAALWKQWCDWLARHRMNYVANWPYSAGTNWWELALDPATKGMSHYSDEEIRRAAKVREELLAYARSRGLAPFLMNYVPGAPTDTIRKNRPDLVGEKWNAVYPAPFALSNPKTTDVFLAQIRAIARTYPSMAGLHLRWWGESFLDPKERQQLQENLTRAMMEALKAERGDLRSIISGFFAAGGTEAYAHTLPEDTIIQNKWGHDWEPINEPGVPMDWIRNVERPFLISQNLPGEEYHSIGGVQYRSVEAGMRKYVDHASRMPNLAGFAIVAGEKDFAWITVLNYLAMARLNWSPEATNVSALVKNYLALHYGHDAVEPAYKAMELTQDAMEEYILRFAGVSHYVNCFRTHNMFGIAHIKGLDRERIEAGHAQLTRHVRDLTEAVGLLEQAADKVKSAGRKSYRDLMIQTQWYADFLASRLLMAEAFIHRLDRDIDGMVAKLKKLKAAGEHLTTLALSKPNISDDFEFEGMTQAIHVRSFSRREAAEIDAILDPANLDRLRYVREVFGEPTDVKVRGAEGTRQPITFEIPDAGKRVSKAEIAFTIYDLDGSEPGDEAVLEFPGERIPLPPTGDGHSKDMVYPIEPDRLKPGTFEAEFILAGRPRGTAGFDVAQCRLIVLYEGGSD